MTPRLLVVDNYDSFTYNLVQLLELTGARCHVEVHDSEVLATISEGGNEALLDYSGIVISPGPGRPENAGRSPSVLRSAAGYVPVLGVCLGHQLIATHFGAGVERSSRPMHGKSSSIHHDANGPFRGLPQGFEAARYHSLIVRTDSLPEELIPCAWTAGGELMGLRHRSLAIVGIQFHPESILSQFGKRLIGNWLEEL